MFVEKDTRKVTEILMDPKDDRRELKLARRAGEFRGSIDLFRSFPESTWENLKHLSLYYNDLTSVEGIGVLATAPLERLSLGRNLLSSIPEEVGSIILFVLRSRISRFTPVFKVVLTSRVVA